MNSEGYGTSGPGSLSFPKTLNQEWRHIIHFQRYEYSRADARTEPTESRAGSLMSLPIPQNLSASYSAKWEAENLGLVGNQMLKAADEVIRNSNARGGGFDSIKQALQEYAGNNIGQKTKDLLTAFGVDKLSQTTPGQVISRAAGVAVNPFVAVLYSAPNLREFSFDYKFVVSNLEEANTLRNMRKEFKMGMHPTFSDAFEDNIFKYPDVWRITIPDDEYLFKFLTCVLTSASFDFHGDGKTYVKGDAKIPLSYNMSLTFQETAILTKEDIESGY